MRIKYLTKSKAIPATATSTVSTTVDLTVSPQLAPFNQGASAMVVLSFNAAAHGAGRVDVLTASDGTTFAVALDDAGNSVSVALPDTAAFGGTSKVFVIQNIKQAIKVKVVGTATGGAGTVDAYLVQE